MDDNDGRVLSTLVRITKLRTNRSAAARLLKFDRVDQRARELRRGQLGHGGGVGVIHRFHELTDARLFQRRHIMEFSEVQKLELARKVGLGALSHMRVQSIPFVDSYHQRASLLDYETRDID